jgi:hypothetical protein
MAARGGVNVLSMSNTKIMCGGFPNSQKIGGNAHHPLHDETAACQPQSALNR